MKIAIIGGKLQGTEAVYLASAAGYTSILIDSNPETPASSMADIFVCGDIVKRDKNVIDAMKEADFVLPANENTEVLEAVVSICREENLKLAFDMDAYKISSSKIITDKMMMEHNIPAPLYYPEGHAPYIIKPSGESGSAGVQYAESTKEIEKFIETCENPENWIIQEYLEGPSYSIEIIGNPEAGYRTYTVTQIHMDEVYDCCKVTAPVGISKEKEDHFRDIALRLAAMVNLHGIMDVEVIDDGQELKVLEIDARIPSQTPIAVLYSSGNNLVSELGDVTVNNRFTEDLKTGRRYSVYEHYMRKDGVVKQEGEHMMSCARPLHVFNDKFGSSVVISDFDEEHSDFRGIFVNWNDDYNRLENTRKDVEKNLKLLP